MHSMFSKNENDSAVASGSLHGPLSDGGCDRSNFNDRTWRKGPLFVSIISPILSDLHSTKNS